MKSRYGLKPENKREKIRFCAMKGCTNKVGTGYYVCEEHRKYFERRQQIYSHTETMVEVHSSR